jgi:hypothetical protein
MHIAEPLLPESISSEVEVVTEKMIKHNASGTDQILVELIKAGDNALCFEIYELF